MPFRPSNARPVVLLSLALLLAATNMGCPGPTPAIPLPPPRPPAQAPAAVAADPRVHKVVAANTAFGFKLLAQLTKASPGKDVFVSPFSVSQALGLALNGSGGETQAALATGLDLSGQSLTDINGANGLLLPSLEDPDSKVQTRIANALWARKGTPLNPAFITLCRDGYGAGAATLDFADPGAADTINHWVSRSTEGKITSLVTPESVAQATVVLTNAVYFHGTWSDPFDKSDTQDAPFHLDNGTTKTLPLMVHGETAYPYRETPQFQMVALPYGSGRMSFYVLLPKPGTNLNTLLLSLNAQTWNAALSGLTPTSMTLFLPRFQVDYSASLNSPLAALGMNAAFAPGADFGPMGLPPGTALSDVVHKAVIEVSEEGTVAAAATGITTFGAIPPPQTVVRIDHPFFCAIRDNATGMLLFIGIIRDPQSLP